MKRGNDMSKKMLGIALLLVALASLNFPSPVFGALATISPQPRLSRVWGTEITFTLDIAVADVEDLYGWEVQLYYDPSVLSATGVTEGPLLKSVGGTYFNFTFNDGYNATSGRVKAFDTLIGLIPGVSGAGVLFTVTFRTVSLGMTIIDLAGTILADPSSNLIPHTVVDGGIEVVSPVRDVAVSSVSVSSDVVISGQIVEIYVTVANLGNQTETFNVTAYCNETVIARRLVDGLLPQSSLALTLFWHTVSIPPNATGTVRVEASEVPDEINLENNMFVYGVIVITQGVRNVAVVSVTTSLDTVYEGDVVRVYVTVANRGNYTETFNVTVYRDSIVINVQKVENLTYGQGLGLVFVWNTGGVQSDRTYKIKAVASAVEGETNLEDNSFTDGNVTVYPRGALSIKITELIPSDHLGQPVTGFPVGTTANFKLTLNCTLIGAKTILLTINLNDAKGNTVGVVSFQGPVASGITTFTMGLPIPSTAGIGSARVYANALSDWPHLGGTPYCPEKSATFEIRGS